MRNVLGWLGSRHGISVGLLLLVGGVIVVARLIPHRDENPLIRGGGTTATAPVPLPIATAPSTQLLHSPVRPVTGKGAAEPRTVATAFTRAWLRHELDAPAWLRGVTRYTTSTLAVRLGETDPSNVPAEAITGTASVVNDAADACAVTVPTDTGTLTLTLHRINGQWRVDDIDWARS